VDRKSLYYLSPGKVQVREEPLPALEVNQVLVRSLFSAISPGTELLLYRGQFPDHLALDESIPALAGEVKYPLKYGYSLVGEIVEVGGEVAGDWIGKRVFSFQPHATYFVSETRSLQVIPDGLDLEDAVFLPNMETALGFVMDGAPLIGERAVIFGQGVVGLLTTALLAKFPLESLLTLDRFALRREASLDLGASESINPQDEFIFRHAEREQSAQYLHIADLVYELTGSPQVLNQAIEAAAYEGRIILGSWYGKKRAEIDLGGWFHRGRLKIISSQVSQIAALHQAGWDKARRFNFAWKMLKQVGPARLITHRIPFQQAERAFTLLDEVPSETIQVVFEY
jgi:2-desacetyl-2-hydroxyethyl bacteriochlorophyllide A dehydrogenase